MALVHGSCVIHRGRGVLIVGPSGSGKSELALRLIDQGAQLVGDDYVDVRAQAGMYRAEARDNIAGLLEVRGMGLMRLPYEPSAWLNLQICLKPDAQIDRLPDSHRAPVGDISECTLPTISLDARSPSALAKINLVLRALGPDSVSWES